VNFIDLAAIAILGATVALGAWAGLFPQLLGLIGAAAVGLLGRRRRSN